MIRTFSSAGRADGLGGEFLFAKLWDRTACRRSLGDAVTFFLRPTEEANCGCAALRCDAVRGAAVIADREGRGAVLVWCCLEGAGWAMGGQR